MKTKQKRRSKRSTLVCSQCGMLGADAGDKIGFMARNGWAIREISGEKRIVCPKCRMKHLFAQRPDLSMDECAALAYAGK